jgi:hypothetical protein
MKLPVQDDTTSGLCGLAHGSFNTCGIVENVGIATVQVGK